MDRRWGKPSEIPPAREEAFLARLSESVSEEKEQSSFDY